MQIAKNTLLNIKGGLNMTNCNSSDDNRSSRSIHVNTVSYATFFLTLAQLFSYCLTYCNLLTGLYAKDCLLNLTLPYFTLPEKHPNLSAGSFCEGI